jgi:hypothetical protein
MWRREIVSQPRKRLIRTGTNSLARWTDDEPRPVPRAPLAHLARSRTTATNAELAKRKRRAFRFPLEKAERMARHESAKTTKLYDRREDELTLDEVERSTT